MNAMDTRTRLLETALDLIWKSNYNSVGVNEICKEAGVTKGGFYHHFESKAALFCEASSYYWERIKRDLDTIMSPANTPLEQMENMITCVLATKFADDPDKAPGCPFFSAAMQTGCTDTEVNDSLVTMSQNSIKYIQALVRSLQSGGFLASEVDVEQTARLINQYLQGATSFALINRCCLDTIRRDIPTALYRLVDLKREHWFKTRPTWVPQQDPPSE